MTTNNTRVAEGARNQVIAISRKLARNMDKSDGAGPEYLMAGLCRFLGAKANPYLKKAGLQDWSEDIQVVSLASDQEMEKLPKLVPGDKLAALLTGPLRPFLRGDMTAEMALAHLIEDPEVTASFTNLLEQVAQQKEAQFAELIRKTTSNVMTGYRIGRSLYSSRNERGESLYASQCDQVAVSQTLDEFNQVKLDLRTSLSQTHSRRNSWYDRQLRLYGPIGADILLVTTIQAVTPFAETGSLILVREVAWTVDPGGYHKNLAVIMNTVRTLRDQGLLRILPETDHCHLDSALLPSEGILQDFADYYVNGVNAGQCQKFTQ